MIISSRWVAHHGHVVPAWMTALRRELVAAFRRGSMDAERCLRTYMNQGEPDILPFEAVVFLVARLAAESEAKDDWRVDHLELAAIRGSGIDKFDDLIEAGREFFFPIRRAIG